MVSGFALSILLISASSSSSLYGQIKPLKEKPFLVCLSDTVTDYQQVLGGPPQTASMHAGLVVLLPSKSVGKHSTDAYEEALVIFSGSGEMTTRVGGRLMLKPNSVAYCPPYTEHDVINTGSQPLRYVYIVAKPAGNYPGRSRLVPLQLTL